MNYTKYLMNLTLLVTSKFKKLAWARHLMAKLRWEDDARNDLRKMGVKNWKHRAQERKQWKEIIEQAKIHKEL
jgi:hypothetical protein